MRLKATIDRGEGVFAVLPDGSREQIGFIRCRMTGRSPMWWPECRIEGCSWKAPAGRSRKDAARTVFESHVIGHYAALTFEEPEIDLGPEPAPDAALKKLRGTEPPAPSPPINP